jgi:hypothetical protein
MEIKPEYILVGYLADSSGLLYWAGETKGGWVSDREKAIRYKTDKSAKRGISNPALYGRDTDDENGQWIFQEVTIREAVR